MRKTKESDIEPPYTINGREINGADIVNDEELEQEIDEFMLFNAGGAEAPEANNEPQQEATSYVDTGKYKVKMTRKGYDWRGLPMINFLGFLRPDYDLIDQGTVAVLRRQLISRLDIAHTAYPDLGGGSSEEHRRIYREKLEKMAMHELHTEVEEVEKQVNARNYGFMYKKGIIAASMAIEMSMRVAGMKRMRQFTTKQIKTMPIYQIVVTKMAATNGAGPFSELSPEMQLGAMILLSAGVHYGLGVMSKKMEKNNNPLYDMLVDQMVGGKKNEDDSANESESEEKPKKKAKKPVVVEEVDDEADPVPSPVEKVKKKKKGSAKGEDDDLNLGGIFNKMSSFLPMIGNMLGGGKKKSKKKHRE